MNGAASPAEVLATTATPAEARIVGTIENSGVILFCTVPSSKPMAYCSGAERDRSRPCATRRIASAPRGLCGLRFASYGDSSLVLQNSDHSTPTKSDMRRMAYCLARLE